MKCQLFPMYTEKSRHKIMLNHIGYGFRIISKALPMIYGINLARVFGVTFRFGTIRINISLIQIFSCRLRLGS